MQYGHVEAWLSFSNCRSKAALILLGELLLLPRRTKQNRNNTHTHTHQRGRERERECLLGYLAFTDLEFTFALAFAVTAFSQIDHVICFFIAATAAYNQHFLIHVL